VIYGSETLPALALSSDYESHASQKCVSGVGALGSILVILMSAVTEKSRCYRQLQMRLGKLGLSLEGFLNKRRRTESVGES
jgi:hypothetical protein